MSRSGSFVSDLFERLYQALSHRLVPWAEQAVQGPRYARPQFEVLEDRTLPANFLIIPLWDGETTEPLLNRYGGPVVTGGNATVSHSTTVAHTGNGSLEIKTNGTIGINGFDFVASSLTGFGPDASYMDTRDITPFQAIGFHLRNTTGSPFTFTFEMKDYRDSNSHRARRSYTIGAADVWTEIIVPLNFQVPGWRVDGNPDFSRTKLFAFVIEANQGAAVNGSIYLDNVSLIEPGAPLDPATAPIHTLLERYAERTFRQLWGLRDRTTGLLPTISAFADVTALNSTAGLIKLLPVAIARGWVSQTDADAYVTRVTTSLGTAMDKAKTLHSAGFIPPRYIDRVTLEPSFTLEESPVDAAFIHLALYQYGRLPGAAGNVKTAIDTLLKRFNFGVFSDTTGPVTGWKLAYDYDLDEGNPGLQPGFTEGTYDGYSGEVYVISLAAHLSTTNRVNIGDQYHSAVNRVFAHHINPNRAHLVHSDTRFRAPFLQWLFPAFADVADRGKDTFPNADLAANPLDNAINYQIEANARLAALNRPLFLQPDASDDGTGSTYEQFSTYNAFAQPDLFMPWSNLFSFAADPGAAEAAFRAQIGAGLYGPLGLTDSVKWATGQPAPTSYPARADIWNEALSLMALFDYLYGGNEFLTNLPEVRAALDTVFSTKELMTSPFLLEADQTISATSTTNGIISTGGSAVQHTVGLKGAGEQFTAIRDGNNRAHIYDQGTWIDTGGYAVDLAAGHNRVYVRDGANQVWVYDLTHGWTATGGYAMEMKVGRSNGYQEILATKDGNNQVYIYNPNQKTWTATGGYAMEMEAGYNRVWIRDGENRVWTYEVSQGWTSTGGFAVSMSSGLTDAQEDYLVVRDASNRVYVYNAAQKTWTGTSGFAIDVEAGMGEIFIRDGSNKVYRYELGNGNWKDTGAYATMLEVTIEKKNGDDQLSLLDGNSILYFYQAIATGTGRAVLDAQGWNGYRLS